MNRTARKMLTVCEMSRLAESLSASRVRKVGCVIASSDFLHFSIAYNGPPSGEKSTAASDQNTSSGELHAEVNALLRTTFSGPCFLVVTCPPCLSCAGYIVNSGITNVILAKSRFARNNLSAVSNAGIYRLLCNNILVMREQHSDWNWVETFLASITNQAKREALCLQLREENFRT